MKKKQVKTSTNAVSSSSLKIYLLHAWVTLEVKEGCKYIEQQKTDKSDIVLTSALLNLFAILVISSIVVIASWEVNLVVYVYTMS